MLESLEVTSKLKHHWERMAKVVSTTCLHFHLLRAGVSPFITEVIHCSAFTWPKHSTQMILVGILRSLLLMFNFARLPSAMETPPAFVVSSRARMPAKSTVKRKLTLILIDPWGPTSLSLDGPRNGLNGTLFDIIDTIRILGLRLRIV